MKTIYSARLMIKSYLTEFPNMTGRVKHNNQAGARKRGAHELNRAISDCQRFRHRTWKGEMPLLEINNR
jgi:hypothetical protein